MFIYEHCRPPSFSLWLGPVDSLEIQVFNGSNSLLFRAIAFLKFHLGWVKPLSQFSSYHFEEYFLVIRSIAEIHGFVHCQNATLQKWQNRLLQPVSCLRCLEVRMQVAWLSVFCGSLYLSVLFQMRNDVWKGSCPLLVLRFSLWSGLLEPETCSSWVKLHQSC